MKNNHTHIVLANESEIQVPVTEESILSCVSALTKGEEVEFALIEVVYVDSDKIVEINSQHLNKNYITDIITFDYSEEDEPIEGTLYCCAPRIQEQAVEFGEPEIKEFHRIIIHGLLHLCGYEDTTDVLKMKMTQKEDHYLSLVTF